MSDLSYAKVQSVIPELKKKDYEVVILGYHSCPYSAKAQSALQKHIVRSKKFKDKSIFVGFDWGETGELKRATGYSGSFPIVFVRNKQGKMEHIGGGNDFSEWVDRDLSQ